MSVIAPLARRKKTKILIPILIIIVLIMAINIWRGFFLKPAQSPSVLRGVVAVSQKKVEINWSVLKNPALDDLTVFDQIPALKETPGRINPFEPY